MLATLLIWLSAAVAILAIIDLFLSDSQKVWLSNAVIKTWNILDEAKGWSFSDWIKEPRATWWLAVGLGLVAGIGSWWVESEREWDGRWIGVVIPLTIAVICFIFARHMFAWLLKSGSLLRTAKITSVVYLVMMMILVARAMFLAEGSSAQWILLAVLLLTLPLVLLFYCGITVFAARGLAYLASAIFYVGEFIVRRVAEYPKGPVIALSALFGSIVALIKAFG